MRLYSFALTYVNGIRAGIQTAHLVHTLYNKYENTQLLAYEKLIEWSHDHKTIIILDAGNSDMLTKTYYKLIHYANQFELPIAHFNEPDMYNCMTVVGLVIPEEIYDCDYTEADNPEDIVNCPNSLEYSSIDPPEYEFYKFIKSFSLAK